MTRSGRFLFVRALVAFLVLPGTIGFLVPSLTRPRDEPFSQWGAVPFGIGLVLLIWCIRDFYVAGQGTLAPWDPPKRLVVVGLYRVSRNPMYVAVLLILCGWALGFHSDFLWSYAAIVAVAFHLRVVFFEEPWLARTHGQQFAEYRAAVPRWLVRWSAHRPVLLALMCVFARDAANGQSTQQPLSSFLTKRIGLGAAQLTALSRGEVVSKVLPTGDERDVSVFAAVHVNVPRSFFVARQKDFAHSLVTPAGSAVGLFGTPAVVSDVAGITITDDDIGDLRDCHPNSCNFKLPATDMDSLRALIDISAADAKARVAKYARQLIVDYVNDYRRRGNTAMLVYDDLGSVRSSDALVAMLRDSSFMLRTVPSLGRHVMNYPRDTLPGATNIIFWAVENLPHVRATLRIMHETVYSPSDLPGTTIFASKQIYADHYFEAGLELLTVMDGFGNPSPTSDGITLIAVRRYRFDHLSSGGWLNLRGHVVDGLRDNAQSDLDRLKHDAESAWKPLAPTPARRRP